MVPKLSLQPWPPNGPPKSCNLIEDPHDPDLGRDPTEDPNDPDSSCAIRLGVLA